MRHRFGQIFLIASLAMVLVAVMLPNTTIGWMRQNWIWFTLPLDRIEGMQSPVNLVHAILFFLLGAAMRIALRHWPFSRVVFFLTLLGVATELVQVAVPGRHARVADVAVDIVAGIVGWVMSRWLIR